MFAREAHELSCLSHNGAPVGRPCDGDATATPELQQPLVAESAQRPQHGVRVDAEHGREVTCGRETLAGPRLAVRNRAPDVSSDLVVQAEGLVAVDLDIQHGASNSSFMTRATGDGSAERPPRTLIARAWRRARRRRRYSLAALVVLALAAALAAGLARHGVRQGSSRAPTTAAASARTQPAIAREAAAEARKRNHASAQEAAEEARKHAIAQEVIARAAAAVRQAAQPHP